MEDREGGLRSQSIDQRLRILLAGFENPWGQIFPVVRSHVARLLLTRKHDAPKEQNRIPPVKQMKIKQMILNESMRRSSSCRANGQIKQPPSFERRLSILYWFRAAY